MSPRTRRLATGLVALVYGLSIVACMPESCSPSGPSDGKPIVTIMAPTANAQVKAGETVDVQATAMDVAGVSRVDVERAANKLKISISTSRPGIIIGRKGQEVDKLKQEIQKKTGKEVFINIQEILKPELDAQLVSESVALQLGKRIASDARCARRWTPHCVSGHGGSRSRSPGD